MIALKKNDKLIILIAIAVVIVAAIGIIAYEPPEDDNSINGVAKGDITYDVTWKTFSKTFYPTVEGEFYAGKNEPYTETFEIDHDNIVNVYVSISWTDDSTYGILFKKGLDTLYASVSYMGTEQTDESTGNGTMEFEFRVHEIPPDTTVTAEDYEDAMDQLTEWRSTEYPSFDTTVSVSTGEKIWRPLKYFRDQGNNFDLVITYEYYEALLEEQENEETKGTGSEEPPEEPEDQFPYMGAMVSMGSSVRW
jgi:hypothetical protein